MLKKSFMLLMFTGLILVGCTDDQPKELPDASEKTEQQAEQNKVPELPGLQIISGNDHISAVRTNFCWDKGNCSLKFKHPKEQEIDHDNVRPGQTFTLFFTGRENPIVPDTIEVTQFHGDGDEEEKFDATNRQITVPSEEGIYYYHIHAIWTEEIEGEVYYVAKVRVR